MSDSPRVIGSFPETPMTGPISSSDIDGLEMLHLDSPRTDVRPRLRVETGNSSVRPQAPLDSPFPLWESSSAFRNYQRQTANQDQSVSESIRRRYADDNVPRLWEDEELEALSSYRSVPGRIADIHAETQRLWDSARDIENLASGDFEVYYNSLDRAPRIPLATPAAESQVQGSEIDHLESRIRENEAQSIDPPLPPLTDMSIGAQRLRIYADLTERQMLIEEMETRLVPDPENPGSLMITREVNPEYGRLIAEVDQLYSRFRDLGDRVHTPAPTANATAFLEDLPVVPSQDLTADETDCNICQEAYGTGCESDVVRLPCNHLFGRQCISTWLTQDDAGLANNTCPMCRAVCFDVPDQRRPHVFLLIGDIVDQFDAAIANGEDDDISDDDGDDSAYLVDVDDEDIREPIPLVWRGAFRFLGDIDHIHFLLSREERHPSQEPIAFLESHNGPIDARYMRPAGTQWDGERSFAEQVLAIFLVFINRPYAPGDRDAEVAAALAALMGRLYESLRVRMRVADCPVVWSENGPPVSFLIDPAAIPLVELALERLVVVESGGRERHSMAVQSGDDEDGDLHAYPSGFDRIVTARRNL